MNTPMALIAELTHRCPLHCVYCSNPLQLQITGEELPAEAWVDVFQQAADLGVRQVHLTGGEPLARSDLLRLIQSAHDCGLYINLITSGIGLASGRLDALVAAGLDHVQLSLQAATADLADHIAGAKAHNRKLAIAQHIRRHKIAFTVNAVIHRNNLEQLPSLIALAADMGAHRLEVAHVQYYGWAFSNREFLLPTSEQLQRSVEIVQLAREAFAGKMRIDFVLPDYYAKFPKACMGGWGRKIILITPNGEAWPCHAAKTIPGLHFENIRQQKLRWIWEQSQSFQHYRGQEWMPEPCRSCGRRKEDFGGCRCQAYLLTNDAGATDPVCSLAPGHNVVKRILEETIGTIQSLERTAPILIAAPWTYRHGP